MTCPNIDVTSVKRIDQRAWQVSVKSDLPIGALRGRLADNVLMLQEINEYGPTGF